MSKKIEIAKEFSSTPGGRYRTDGPFSGQAFREDLLEPCFSDESDASEITVVLDGVFGFGSSFLEEAFGGLVRNHGLERCIKRLHFISDEDPIVVEDIQRCMDNATSK